LNVFLFKSVLDFLLKFSTEMLIRMMNGTLTHNEWLYVFGFATHTLSFKTQKPIGKTDIYNVLATVNIHNLKTKI